MFKHDFSHSDTQLTPMFVTIILVGSVLALCLTMNFFYMFQYQKPPEEYGLEKKILPELKKIKPYKEGDVECNPS
jgi:hypothetical protein